MIECSRVVLDTALNLPYIAPMNRTLPALRRQERLELKHQLEQVGLRLALKR